MDTEYRFAPFELRGASDGPGVLSGIALPYRTIATVAPGLRERFEPGAFGPDVAAMDVLATWQHDRALPLARTRGGGLVLSDGPEALRAEVTLPDTAAGRDVAVLAQRGVLSGFSVEFHAKRDRVEGGVRVVESAWLSGVSIVDSPAYPDAVIAALRARIEGAERHPARNRRRLLWL